MQIDDLNTGDLVLFHGEDCVLSDVVEHFTHSKWSHCGMVVRDPDFTSPALSGIYLWESGSEPTSNPEEDKRTLGVQFTELRQKIESYTGTVGCRQLSPGPIPMRTLRNVHEIVHAKPYNVWMMDWVRMVFPFLSRPQPIDKRYWCSALVGRLWQASGVLPEDTDWSQLTPGALAHITPQPPYKLDQVKQISS